MWFYKVERGINFIVNSKVCHIPDVNKDLKKEKRSSASLYCQIGRAALSVQCSPRLQTERFPPEQVQLHSFNAECLKANGVSSI